MIRRLVRVTGYVVLGLIGLLVIASLTVPDTSSSPAPNESELKETVEPPVEKPKPEPVKPKPRPAFQSTSEGDVLRVTGT